MGAAKMYMVVDDKTLLRCKKGVVSKGEPFSRDDVFGDDNFERLLKAEKIKEASKADIKAAGESKKPSEGPTAEEKAAAAEAEKAAEEEAIEEQRVEAIEERMKDFDDAVINAVMANDLKQTEEILDHISNIEVTKDIFQEYFDEAKATHEQVFTKISELVDMKKSLAKFEAEAKEAEKNKNK